MCLLTVMTLKIGRFREYSMRKAQPSYFLKTRRTTKQQQQQQKTIRRVHNKDGINFTMLSSVLFYTLNSEKRVHLNTSYPWKPVSFYA